MDRNTARTLQTPRKSRPQAEAVREVRSAFTPDTGSEAGRFRVKPVSISVRFFRI